MQRALERTAQPGAAQQPWPWPPCCSAAAAQVIAAQRWLQRSDPGHGRPAAQRWLLSGGCSVETTPQGRPFIDYCRSAAAAKPPCCSAMARSSAARRAAILAIPLGDSGSLVTLKTSLGPSRVIRGSPVPSAPTNRPQVDLHMHTIMRLRSSHTKSLLCLTPMQVGRKV